MADNGQKKKATARTPSAAYSSMENRWHLMDAVLGGTEAMRVAGETYLPRHTEESPSNYASRLARSSFFNMTELTLDRLAGKPFSHPIVPGEDVPTEILDLFEDVDLQGHNVQAFSRTWFRTAWAKGFSHVLVEFPTKMPVAEGQVRTLEDDRKENLRPFWVHVRPENLLAAYAELIDGKEVLTHIRILETTVERVEFEEIEKVRVRVIEQDAWYLYKLADEKKPDGDWIVDEEGANELGIIPLVTFYAGKREGLMECKPPLTDLAHLNISHWQSSSDQRNILSVARFPILAGAGVPDEAAITVGPNNYLVTADPQGKWYFVEHNGAAIDAGQKDLESLEDKMAGYGAEFLKKRPGNEAEGSRKLDSAEGNSYLEATVADFQDALEQVMLVTAMWLGLEDGGSVSVSLDAETEEVNPTELDAIVKSRAARDLSQLSFLNELIRRGVLAEDFSVEDNKLQLEDEAPEGMGDMTGEKHPNGQPKFDEAGNELGEDGKPIKIEEEVEEEEEQE